MAPREEKLGPESAGKSAASLLPSRPFSDPDGEHCQLRDVRFSFVPRKRLAEMTLPPVQFRRSLTEPGLIAAAGRNKRVQPSTAFNGRAGAGEARMCAGMANPVLNKCHGDHCGADICPPPSLQDLESSEDPWMMQARELCKHGIGGIDASQGQVPPLMRPEEIAECLQLPPDPKLPRDPCFPERVPAKFGFAGDIMSSWIFEARAYPRLCKWLETTNWMLDPKDPDQVEVASRCLIEDEDASGGEPKFMAHGILQGVRHRLKTVPVCSTCFCIYNVVHAAIVNLKRQGGGKWSKRQQVLRRTRSEQCKREEGEKVLSHLISQRKNQSSELPEFNATSAHPKARISALGESMTRLLEMSSSPKTSRGKDVQDLRSSSSPKGRMPAPGSCYVHYCTPTFVAPFKRFSDMDATLNPN